MQRAEEAPIQAFSKDLMDGGKYIQLMDQICPPTMDRTQLEKAASSTDSLERARLLLEYAKQQMKIHCYITARDIVQAHARLNMTFVAELFNHYIGIHLPTDEEIRALYNTQDTLQHQVKQLQQRSERDQQELSEQRQERAQQQAYIRELEARLQESLAGSEQLARSHVESMRQQEASIASRLETVKSTYRQQIHQMEHTFDKTQNQWKKESHVTADILRDFLSREGGGDARKQSSRDEEENVRELVMQVLALHDGKTRSLHNMEAKMKRLEHVNDLIGDKVQEYAEGLMQSKKSGAKKKLFGF